jgi:5-formyltetrahydrofolate cyclo-ligase
LPSAAVAAAARRIAELGIGFLDVPPGSIVGAFASMPDELQTAPLRTRLYAQGYRIALPVIMGKGKPLIFRAWAPGDNMGRGVWDIPEPKADKPELLPDVMLTALLAFDDWGWRLGYGGGFYDRTLRALRALKPVIAVGLAYDEQHVDSVPHLDYDERLDWVLTPSGPRRCKKG